MPPQQRRKEMSQEVRAKFRVHAVQHAQGTEDESAMVNMIPVYADCPENESWSKYTPSGEIRMFITNPQAIAFFEVGQECFVTFSRAK
jgi:hypothetical protein